MVASGEAGLVDIAEGATAEDSETGRVRRDLLDIREQFAAASEVLVSLGQSSSSNDAVLDTLVSSVCRLCRGDAAMVFLAEGNALSAGPVHGLSSEYVRFIGEHPVSADRRTLVGRVGLDRRLQQITDVLSDPEYGRYDAQQVAGFRTIVGAPMLFDERLVGVLSVWRNAVEPFDDRFATLLTTFAAQAAIVISHVELVRALELRTSELARKVDQLETLGAVIEAVNSSLDLDQVLAMIVMHAVHLSGTDGGSIMEFDDQRQEFAVRAAYGTSDELIDELRRTPIDVNHTFVGRAALAGVRCRNRTCAGSSATPTRTASSGPAGCRCSRFHCCGKARSSEFWWCGAEPRAATRRKQLKCCSPWLISRRWPS